MLAYSKRLATEATKQSKRLLNAALPCGYDAAMIEDDPARANFEYAQFVERRIGETSSAYEVARQQLDELVKRRAELQIEILEGKQEQLKQWMRHDDNVRAIRDELREMVPSGVYPNDSPYFDEPHDKAMHDAVLESTPPEMLEEMYKLGSQMQDAKLLRDRAADQLDFDAKQVQKELDLLLEREEPLGWDVINRKTEMDRAVSARKPWPSTGNSQVIMPRPHPGYKDPDQDPVNISFDPDTGEPVFRQSDIIYPKELARTVEANDRTLGRIEAERLKKDKEQEAINAEVEALRKKVAAGDHRQIRKFRKLPGKSERKGVHPFFNNAINALNARQREGTLEGSTFTVSFAAKSKKYADAHPREMLALRHGIVHPKGPLEFKVYSRMDEDQNNLHVWIEDYQKDAYVAIYVTDAGTWEITTTLHEVKAWIDAENDLYPGIKHEVGQYTLEELAIRHHKIAEHLEANSDIVA